MKNARLHRDPVDQALHRRLVALDVSPEDGDRAVVGQQQRRDEADQRALAGAVRPEDAEYLAPPDLHGHVVHRHYRLASLGGTVGPQPLAQAGPLAEHLARTLNIQREIGHPTGLAVAPCRHIGLCTNPRCLF